MPIFFRVLALMPLVCGWVPTPCGLGPAASCATQGWFLNLSVPQFLRLEMG